jgi:surface protein
MHPKTYIYICVCASVCYLFIHTLSILSVCVRIGRGYECVHQCAMVMDRLCAHALAGSCCGLGLKPETLSRASPCPSAWTACGFGAQAFYGASAFNADIGSWNTASVSNMESVCAAPGPADAHYGGRARPGFGAARPVVRGGTADARARSHTCRHSLARCLGCRYGGPEGRFDTCIRICIYVYIYCVRVCYTRIHTYIHTLSIYLYV